MGVCSIFCLGLGVALEVEAGARMKFEPISVA